MNIQARRIKIMAMTMVLTLPGCTSWLDSGEKDPKVQLNRIELVQAKLLEQRFKLHFLIDNPSDSTLTVRGMSYTVYLGTIKLTEGQYEKWFSIDPHGRANYVIPVRTNLWPQIRPLVKLLETPDQPIPYRFEGTLETGLFYGNDVHVRRKGEIIPGDLIPE